MVRPDRLKKWTIRILAIVLLSIAGTFSYTASASPQPARPQLASFSPSLTVLSSGPHPDIKQGSCSTTFPTPNGVAYTPSQIRTAYSFSNSANGAGETIAILDAFGSPSITSDLNCFDQVFGIPPPPSFQIVYPFGTAQPQAGFGAETALDVEWAHAMAPSASILLIITPDNSCGPGGCQLIEAVSYAVQHGAKVISMSFGGDELQFATAQPNGCSFVQSLSSIFANAVAAGAIPVAASGDHGAFSGTTSPTVWYPAADPNVVGVGGTTLTTTSTFQYSNEVVWNRAPFATGGGVSACFSEPSYQSSAGIMVTTASSSFTPSGRAVPDVAYDADGFTGFWVYDTFSFPGWIQVLGTSAGTPQWSSIFADALSTGVTNLNGLTVHGLIYSKLLGTNAVHDITSGNNNFYFASPGYDACTGVGTPVESNVLKAL